MHSDRVTTTAETRKSSKPIMEKKRRARINASLAELKSLLLEVIKKEGARHSKMEKADILEMAVKHLRQIQRQQYTGGGSDPTLSDKYRLGFNECAQEVSRYLGASEDDDAELRARLLNHLANYITSSTSPVSSPSSSPGPSPGGVQRINGGGTTSLSSVTGAPLAPIPLRPSKPAGGSFGGQGDGEERSSSAQAVVPVTEINNNIPGLANNNLSLASVGGSAHRVTLATVAPSQAVTMSKLLGELQVMPNKSAGGEVAFVLPAGQLPSLIIPVYASTTGLAAAGVSVAGSGQSSSALPVSLPIMTSQTVSPTPGVVALSPQVGLQHAMMPPVSLTSMLTTGLGGTLSWQPVSSPIQMSTTSTILAPASSVSTASVSSSCLPENVQLPASTGLNLRSAHALSISKTENLKNGSGPPAENVLLQPQVLCQDVWRPW